MVLRFSRAMVDKTGTTSSLRDVAILLRAFKTGPGGVVATLTKIFKRPG